MMLYVPRRPTFNPATMQYEHPDLGDEPEHDPYASADMEMVKRIGDHLMTHYPGYAWYVTCSHRTKVAQISLPGVMRGTNQKMIVHLDRVRCDPKLRDVTRVAGELLERYRLPRVGFRADDWISALRRQPLIGARHVPE